MRVLRSAREKRKFPLFFASDGDAPGLTPLPRFLKPLPAASPPTISRLRLAPDFLSLSCGLQGREGCNLVSATRRIASYDEAESSPSSPNAHQHLHHLTTAAIGLHVWGACAKPPPPTPSERGAAGGLRRPRSAKRRVRVRGHAARPPRDWWTTSSNEMDNHSTLSPRSFHNFPASATATMSTTAYSNQALALWNEQRCAWVGTQPRPPPPREPREPAISWNTTYEDLLATSRPFAQPIPLTEMVDFLVDVWEQEGLYERR